MKGKERKGRGGEGEEIKRKRRWAGQACNVLIRAWTSEPCCSALNPGYFLALWSWESHSTFVLLISGFHKMQSRR